MMGPNFATQAKARIEKLKVEFDGERLLSEALGLFEDDEKAKLMFEGMMEEMEGEELRAFLELTSTEFNSKRRLVRRRLNNHFEGRRP